MKKGVLLLLIIVCVVTFGITIKRSYKKSSSKVVAYQPDVSTSQTELMYSDEELKSAIKRIEFYQRLNSDLDDGEYDIADDIVSWDIDDSNNRVTVQILNLNDEKELLFKKKVISSKIINLENTTGRVVLD